MRWCATFCDPVKSVIFGFALRKISFIVAPSQLMKSRSVAGAPHSSMSLMNCSSTMETFVSDFTNALFPMKSAPMSCNTGISKGKLKGVMTETGPYGHRNPCDVWPRWSPETENPRARKRTLSPAKFSKNFRVTTTSARA